MHVGILLYEMKRCSSAPGLSAIQTSRHSLIKLCRLLAIFIILCDRRKSNVDLSVCDECVNSVNLFSCVIIMRARRLFSHTHSPNGCLHLQTPHQFLKILDYVCTAFFSLELITRVAFSPSKRQFFTTVMNIIDILALLPLYVQNFLELTDGYSCLGTNRVFVETIFILRIIRIFRIFHILKHYKALKILLHAIKASIQELLMLAIFLFIGMLIFSTMIFYAEGPNPFIVSDEKVSAH